MLTGLYPSNHDLGLVQKDGRLDVNATVMLQECMRMAGYRTGAFVSSFVLRKSFGLDAGFEVYDDEMTGTELNRESQPIRGGRETNAAALGWLEKTAGDGVFAWVHYFDAHGPYVQPDGFEKPFSAADFGDGPLRLPLVKDGLPGGIPMYQALGARRDEEGNITSCDDDLRLYLAGYDNGVRYQDEVLGEFVDGLKRLGMYDDTIIVVTSDHGEALGEDDVYFFHGLTVTPEQSSVPLIVKPHAGYSLRSADTPVSTVDIMPTLLDAAEIERRGLRLDGASLSEPDPARMVKSENEWQRALVSRDGYLVSDKDVVYDGYEYYFDARGLLRGDRLWETGTWVEEDAGREVAPELSGYMDILRSESDPKERKIKTCDSKVDKLLSIANHRADIIAFKDGVISDLRAEMSRMEADLKAEMSRREDEFNEAVTKWEAEILKKVKELSECKTQARRMSLELDSMLNSSSWKLTYPLRWISARLKGQMPRH